MYTIYSLNRLTQSPPVEIRNPDLFHFVSRRNLMLKRILALALLALSLLSIAPAANAQAYGTYAYCSGVWRMGGCGGVVALNGAPVGQLVALPGNPGMFTSGNNQYRCSALTGWTGGIIGAAVGWLVGKNVKLGGHHMNVAGAAAGAYAGHEIACELVRPTLVATSTNGVAPGNVRVRTRSAEEWMGDDEVEVRRAARPRTIHEESDCDVDGVASMQDMKGLTKPGCADKAKQATVKGPSDCGVAGHPELQGIKGLTDAGCANKAKSAAVNRPGHCIVAGVSYPEFIDNAPGCKAKWEEVRAAGNRQAEAMQVAAAPVISATRDNKVRACRWSEGPGTPVLAVSVPDPRNPNWKMVPSNPGETCLEWKERIKTTNG